MKIYDCNSDMQYYVMCVNQLRNSNKETAEMLFNLMPKSHKKAMIKAMFTNWKVEQDFALFFFDLL